MIIIRRKEVQDRHPRIQDDRTTDDLYLCKCKKAKRPKGQIMIIILILIIIDCKLSDTI